MGAGTLNRFLQDGRHTLKRAALRLIAPPIVDNSVELDLE
jgi:hypothetical protein